MPAREDPDPHRHACPGTHEMLPPTEDLLLSGSAVAGALRGTHLYQGMEAWPNAYARQGAWRITGNLRGKLPATADALRCRNGFSCGYDPRSILPHALPQVNRYRRLPFPAGPVSQHPSGGRADALQRCRRGSGTVRDPDPRIGADGTLGVA